MKISILSLLVLIAASAVAHPAPARKCHPKHHNKAPAAPSTVADNYGYGSDVTQAAPTQVAPAPAAGGLYGDDKAPIVPAVPTGAYDGAAPAAPAPTGSYDAPAPVYGKRPAPSKGDKTPVKGDETPVQGDKTPAKGDKTPGHYGKNPHYKPNRPAYPWEDPKQVGTGKYPGHEPVVHAPVYGGKLPVYGKRPRPPKNDTKPVEPPKNDTKPVDPPTPVDPPCFTCVPFTGAPNQPYVPGYGGEELIKKPLPNDNKPFQMTLVHTNDIHARMDEFSSSGIDCTDKNRADKRCFGGIARIKTLVDSIREKDPNVYMVDAGDEFQGTLFYNYYKGNVTAEYMNMIGLDAFAVGNHEFDDGPAHLGQFIKKLNMPAISSNMDTSAEPALKGMVAPYTVFTKYGSRVGVIGFITKTTPDISASGKLVKFSDPVGANGPVQRAVDQLHALGIKRIIAVSHNGLEDDRLVAASTRGISVIVGGHSHSLMHKNSSLAGVRATYPLPVKNAEGQDTYIVQAKAWGEWVGRLQISWDAESKLTALNGDPIQLTMDIPQHNATQEIVKKWREPFDAIARVVIGNAPKAMPRGPCNGIGCSIGYFVADTLRQSYKSPANNPVIGMTNVGGMRSDIAAGDVTVGTIMTVLPFPNTATTVPMTGAQVTAMLENIALTRDSDGVRADGKRVTSFAQYAGLRADLDSKKPKFERVSKVEVEVSEGKWEAIDAAKTYEVVMVDFLSNIGGDAIIPPELVRAYETRQMLSDLALEYVKAIKTLDFPAEKFTPGVRFI